MKDMQNQVSDHWSDQLIRLKYLIREYWQKLPDGSKKLPRYRYVVFIDADDDLDWIVDDEHSSIQISTDTYKMLAKIEEAESHSSSKLSNEDQFNFKRILGTSIVLALENENDSAEVQRKHALSFLQQRVHECSREWTLFGASALVAIGCLIFYATGHWFWSAPAFFGMLGTYVSIVRRTGNRYTDANAGLLLHIIETMVRMCVGIIFGCIAIALASSSLAPKFCQEACLSAYGIYVLSFVAGLFDTFVPSMISRYIITSSKAD